MKKYCIAVFRHGQSRYRQGNEERSWLGADDLAFPQISSNETAEEYAEARQKAIDEVRKSAEKLIKTLRKGTVNLIRSPTGRTTHTLAVIYEILRAHGFDDIWCNVSPAIGEMQNFSWDIFAPLLNGGSILCDENEGQTQLVIDKNHTNPDNLSYPDYIMSDAVRRIGRGFMDLWPESFRRAVESFESFDSVTRRALEEFSAHRGGLDRSHYIFVTHDSCTMHLTDKYTGGRQKGLAPGSYMTLELSKKKHLVVTGVGDITDGDNKSNFFGGEK
jgi:broad specificity phosphatase PhoE